jgi:hypothetical protein
MTETVLAEAGIGTEVANNVTTMLITMVNEAVRLDRRLFQLSPD